MFTSAGHPIHGAKTRLSDTYGAPDLGNVAEIIAYDTIVPKHMKTVASSAAIITSPPGTIMKIQFAAHAIVKSSDTPFMFVNA
jgi:hypothetical protein